MSSTPLLEPVVIRQVASKGIDAALHEWLRFTQSFPQATIGADPRWLAVLRDGLGHCPYGLEARRGEELCGLLPVALVQGPLFGRFLVSLPFVSTCGVLSRDEGVVKPLLDAAVGLADELRVKQLEVRLQTAVEHDRFEPSQTSKVLMTRPLPDSAEKLWKDLDSKVRNQVRKGEKQSFEVQWGGSERQEDFYRVFSRNMRDLGTPVFGRSLFTSIVQRFGEAAEFCVVKLNQQAVAAALLIHGRGITEVPCASALREFNATNANMFMYWQLLQRGIERGSATFDFGRSTPGGGTERFKLQWGGEPAPAAWQCYYRTARPTSLRKESPVFSQLTRAWRCLPLRLAEVIGPAVVRGIP